MEVINKQVEVIEDTECIYIELNASIESNPHALCNYCLASEIWQQLLPLCTRVPTKIFTFLPSQLCTGTLLALSILIFEQTMISWMQIFLFFSCSVWFWRNSLLFVPSAVLPPSHIRVSHALS